MALNSFDAVFYALAFIVPGFIADSVLCLVVPRKSSPSESSVLRFLTLSCYNYAIWSWLIYLVAKTEFFEARPVAAAIVWGFVVLVSPIALGLLVGVLRQRSLITRCLHRLGLRAIQPNPTAWDQFFIKTEPVFALVTLKDGVHFAGRFGPQSAASSDGHDRDIYLESVFTPGTPWAEVPGSAGVWIRGDEIKHIEFHRNAL
jgi:hypothetical protein